MATSTPLDDVMVSVTKVIKVCRIRGDSGLATATTVADVVADMVDRGHVFRSIGEAARDDLSAEEAARLVVTGEAPLPGVR